MAEQKKDSKTTWHGITGAIGVVLIGVAAFFDGDPETVADTAGVIQAIGVILGALGLSGLAIKAKDKDDA